MGFRATAAAAVMVCLTAGVASAQQANSWVVKPEWVRAHEAFLASDAMRGRGSATHDEEVAATYVASEFEGYGLVHAPGMMSYIQSAEIDGPTLDGHAVLTAGDVRLPEGAGVTLVLSSGETLSGPLVRVKEAGKAKVPRGAIVVVTALSADEISHGALRNLLRGGAAALVLPENAATDRMYQAAGGKTRTPLHLAAETERRAYPTILTLDPAHLQQLVGVAEGTTATLTVKASERPRETYNAIGYLPGTDPAAGTILLTAHLDHLGVGTPENGDAIWNGANDDAAGTTAVLELAHALTAGQRPRRSVLFVCYGSEELGEFGSTYFGEHPPVPLKDLVANLEFEMIGNQDPKMPKGVLLLTGWDRSNLGPALKAHGALVGPDPYPEQHYFERSDNYALALKGVVAHTAAGWGDPPTYHRPDDDLVHLDVPFMTRAIQSLVGPVEWLADSDFVPRWNPGGQPKEK